MTAQSSGIQGIHRTAVFLLAGIAALFIGEWSVRLALPAYDPAAHVHWTYHPVAGAVLGRPGTSGRQIKNSGDYDVEVSFNRHGFRDRQDVATGTRDDIYVIGDSFTFGWGIEAEERFSNILASLTGRRVFNLGSSLNVDGYERVIGYAEKLGARLDTLVLGLNMIDDVFDYPPAAPMPAGGLPKEPEPAKVSSTPLTLHTLKVFLLRHSALYFLLTNTLNDIPWLRRTLIRLGLIRTIETISARLPEAAAIETTADRIAAIGRDYDLTVLMIPSRGLWLGDAQAATHRVHEQVRVALERRGVRVIDPRRRLEEGDDPLQYHFRNDGHWNPRGHRVAAQELAGALAGNR